MPSFDRTSITLLMLAVAIMIALLSILTKPLPEPPPELHLGVQRWRTEQGADVRFIPRRSSNSFVSLRWAAFHPNLATKLDTLCQQTQTALTTFFNPRSDQTTTDQTTTDQTATASCRVTQTGESIELLLRLPSEASTLKAVTDLWQIALKGLFTPPAADEGFDKSPSANIAHDDATAATNTWIGIVAPLSKTQAQILIEQLLKHQPAGSPQSMANISVPTTTTDLSLETTSATNPSFVAAYALKLHLDPMATVKLQPGILKSRLQLTSSAKPDTLLDRLQHPPSKEVLHQYWFDWYRMSAQQVDQPNQLATLLSAAGYLGWPREHLLYWHQLWSQLTVDQLETQWLKWYEVQTISSQTLQSQAAGTPLKQSANHRR
jgi:hypothetical protein